MMGGVDDLADIRARLDAVARLDWSTVERGTEAVELYNVLDVVGPVLMTAPPDPADEHPKFHQEAEASVREHEAVIDFLTHVVADMRRLLDEMEHRG